jgi:hypothetical protein
MPIGSRGTVILRIVQDPNTAWYSANSVIAIMRQRRDAMDSGNARCEKKQAKDNALATLSPLFYCESGD